jgi:hypothetical protein
VSGLYLRVFIGLVTFFERYIIKLCLRYIATLIDYLVSRGKTSYGSVHFNGHSLGSHVGGFAGSNSGGQIGRITGNF